MKKILLTVITLFVVFSGYAQYQLPTEEVFFNLNQPESSRWEGRWYRFGEEGDVSYMNFDASAYDYVWIKFSGNTSRFRLGIFYNEWKSTQAWGEQPWDDYVYIYESEGYAFIKLEKTKTYEFIGPNKEASPYAGDTWDKHIREVFTQDDGVPVKVNVEGIWFGTQAQFDALPLVYESLAFKFTKTSASTCVVSGFKSSVHQYVKIPSTFGAWTVTGISEGALKGVGDYNSLNEVVISDGITSIGERAFAMQTNLTSVTLPEGLTVIETGVFEGCTSLSQFNIPSTVEVIKPVAFNALSSNFRYLKIPESVQTICSQAFCVDPSTASQVTVICDSPTPPAVDVKTKDSTSDQWYEGSSFIGVGGSKIGKLIVPLGSKAAYEASDWKNSFSEIVEESIVNNVLIGDFYFNLNTMGKAEVTSNPNKYSGEIVIPESITYDDMSYKVTSIGEDAFSGCSSMTSVQIPNSVTSIGDNAFSGCNNLASVFVKSLVPFDISDNVFPNKEDITLYVQEISYDAYSSATSWSGYKEIVAVTQEYTDGQGIKYTLNTDGRTYAVSGHTDVCTGTIIIPETVNGCSVTSIDGNVFSGCSGLTSITIPKCVTSIVFYRWGLYDGIIYPDELYLHLAMGCDDLVSIIVEEGNPKYDSRDNCNAIIETATNTLIAGCKNTTIPSSVKSIGRYAFGDCSGLTSITIPNGVTTICEDAFSGCSGLTSINISSSVTSIGELAFRGCSGLTSVTIPNSVTSIENLAFLGCSGLTSIKVEDGNTVYDSRDNCNAIIEKSNNTLIAGCKNTIIPSTVTTIGDHAFYSCFGLTSVTIPNSLTAIGSDAFAFCSGLTDIYCYAENVPTTTTDTFWDSNIGNATLYVPEASIEAYKAAAPWSEFKNIMAIELKDLIGQEYTDDQGVKYTFNAQGSYTVSGYTDACEGEIIIPETVNGYSVTSIGSGAFNHCSGLTSITIPQSVTLISIGINYDYPYSPFFDCKSLSTIVVEEGNPVYDSRDNCNAIIETTTNKLLIGCKNTIIPNSVTSVGDFAFIGCEGLVSITIPKSVTSFGFALHTCTGLTSIIVEEGNPKYDSRDNCNAIIETATNTLIAGCKKTTIPNNVKTIYYNAFVGCSGLTSVKIPNSVTLINSWSLGAITGLTDVYCYAEKAPTVEANGFAMSNIENATLHVPEGCIDAYKAATPWSDFKNIVAINTEVSISISGSGKTTLTSSEALDFSGFEDLKAYVATGYEGSGTIWLTRVKQVPANTPILIKGEADKTYEVPVMNKCDAYFENMFNGSADEDQTINSTTEDGKYMNFYMADGIFKPAPDNKTIKAGKCYLQVPATFNTAKAGDDQTVKIADSGKSSYAPPVDVDLTDVEGLKAYAATGYDAASQTIWLTRINKIQAGEGVMLKGESGKEYTLHASEVQAYYGNMFVGNIGSKITINETSDDGEWTNFYLASGSFKKVNGTREIGTNKSYLHLPTSLLVSSARGKKNAGIDEWFMEELETETMFLGSIGGDDEDGTTRIDVIRNDNAQPDVYYNLQGQRVDAPKKGIYIHNGRKVVIK